MNTTQIGTELGALKVGQSVSVSNIRAELLPNGLYWTYNYLTQSGRALSAEGARLALVSGKVR